MYLIDTTDRYYLSLLIDFILEKYIKNVAQAKNWQYKRH